MYPKIELHVHLEATIAPAGCSRSRGETTTRCGWTPSGTRGAVSLSRFRSLHRGLDPGDECARHYEDFRQVVIDYAEEAKRHGAVYIEGVFSPIERAWRGVDWDEIFSGYCDGAVGARERHEIEVRLAPDTARSFAWEAL